MSIPIEELKRIDDQGKRIDINNWLGEVDKVGTKQDIKTKLKSEREPNRVLFTFGYSISMILGACVVVGVCLLIGC